MLCIVEGLNYPPIIERKIKPDGSVREYACRLVHIEPGFAVIRFVVERGGIVFDTPIDVPADSVSYGYFWKRRPYSVYRMKRRDGSLVAHRFDASTVVEIATEAITYRDLVLDWWVTPSGEVIEEDLAEFEDLVERRCLAARDLRLAAEAARQVLSRYRHIIDELDSLERRLDLESQDLTTRRLYSGRYPA